MLKKIALVVPLMFSPIANAFDLGYSEPERLTVQDFQTESFKYAGENELLAMYINKKLVYNISTNPFEKIRLAPIRFDLLQDFEKDKAGTTYVTFMNFNCHTKQVMTLFSYVYNEKGQFTREERKQSFVWNNTEEYTNLRLLNEYICQ